MEGFLKYFRDYWLLDFPKQAAHVFLIAVVFELLVFIVNRLVIRRLMAPVLRRDAQCDPGFRARRRGILLGVLTRLNRYALYAMAVLMILDEFRVDVMRSVLPVGLAAAVIVCVALRRVLMDAGAGFVLLFELRYAPGDTVTLDGLTGTVVEMGLRTTRLVSASGEDVVIANAEVLRIARQAGAAVEEESLKFPRAEDGSGG